MPRPRKPDALTPAERNRRAREKRAGAVTLTPQAAADLDALRLEDEPRSTALARVLAYRAIPAPPPTLREVDDRDYPCSEAVEPQLDDVLLQSVGAGWHPAEVVTATLGWAVHQAASGAGPLAAHAMLRDAIEMLDIRAEAGED